MADYIHVVVTRDDHSPFHHFRKAYATIDKARQEVDRLSKYRSVKDAWIETVQFVD